MNGGPHSVPTSPHVLADNGHLHAQVLELFGEVFRGPYRVPIPHIVR
jgi:hypothetical protein